MKSSHRKGTLKIAFLLSVMGLLLLEGCATWPGGPDYRLPPITDAPTRQWHPGKIVWHDLLTTDLPAARRFYGELFGWTFREIDGYTEIHHGGRKIGGLLPLQPTAEKPVASQWLMALSVPDLDAALEQVKGSGGRLINGPLDLGPRGTGALIADPAGAHLLLLHARGGDPADRRPDLGDWLWNEVWALKAKPLVDFYRRLGHYEAVLEGEDYRVFVGEGRWRAGLRLIDQPAYAGRWVPVVRVADPAALLDEVRRLGGEVWRAPGEGAADEDTALIADDTGALLILQRWTFTAAGEEE